MVVQAWRAVPSLNGMNVTSIATFNLPSDLRPGVMNYFILALPVSIRVRLARDLFARRSFSATTCAKATGHENPLVRVATSIDMTHDTNAY